MREGKLEPDEELWLPVAGQVMRGDFDNADSSTKHSIVIGLRGINHISCKQAVMKLEGNK